MIRFKQLEYSNDLLFFKFNLDDKKFVGKANLEQNPKTLYTQLAKFYKLKGCSKYNKNDLIQHLVDQQGFEFKVDEITKALEKIVIQESVEEESVEEESVTNILEKISINEVRINPWDELGEKLLNINNLNIDPQFIEIKKDSLCNCYAYRCWLWDTYNRTYEEETNRVDEIMKERYSLI